MKIERLDGPHTHITWTPDATPLDEQELVCLVRHRELLEMENRIAVLEESLRKFAPMSARKTLGL